MHVSEGDAIVKGWSLASGKTLFLSRIASLSLSIFSPPAAASLCFSYILIICHSLYCRISEQQGLQD